MTLLLAFLGKFLKGLDRTYLIRLMIILLFVDCIQPMLGCNALSNIGYGLLHCITVYVVGYVIKTEQISIKKLYYVIIFTICVVLIGFITIVSLLIAGDRIRTIDDYNSPLMVIQSIAFFLFFKSLKIEKVSFSKISPYIFGVYLLNDNSYAREFLWQKVFYCRNFYESYFLPLHFIVTVILFLVIALIIEYLRINLWKKLRRIHK